MTGFVKISPEQEQHMAVIRNIEADIAVNEEILKHAHVMERAKQVLARAYELELPEQAYIGLRSYVSRRERKESFSNIGRERTSDEASEQNEG